MTKARQTDELSEAIRAALSKVNARLPLRTDDDAIIYDGRGEEIGYIVHIPDAATARVIAACIVNAVNCIDNFAAVSMAGRAGELRGRPK